jgi:hypothetical protein
MLRRVALVRTDVSEEFSASFIRVTRIGELGIILAVTSNQRKLRINTKYFFFLGISSHPSSPILVTLIRFLEEPHGVTSQKTPFFIITAMKTSNLTRNVFDMLRCLGFRCIITGTLSLWIALNCDGFVIIIRKSKRASVARNNLAGLKKLHILSHIRVAIDWV